MRGGGLLKFLFFSFWPNHCNQKFLGQGLNLSHSGDGAEFLTTPPPWNSVLKYFYFFPLLSLKDTQCPLARPQRLLRGGPEGSTLGMGPGRMRGPWRTCQGTRKCFSFFLFPKRQPIEVASIGGYLGIHLSRLACG